jgi:hypothetical protein
MTPLTLTSVSSLLASNQWRCTGHRSEASSDSQRNCALCDQYLM